MINMYKKKKPDRVRNWTVMYLQQQLQVIPWGTLNVRWLLRFISSWGKLVGHLHPCFDKLLLDVACHQREGINLCKTSPFNGRSSISNTLGHLREWIPQSWKGFMELTAVSYSCYNCLPLLYPPLNWSTSPFLLYFPLLVGKLCI